MPWSLWLVALATAWHILLVAVAVTGGSGRWLRLVAVAAGCGSGAWLWPVWIWLALACAHGLCLWLMQGGNRWQNVDGERSCSLWLVAGPTGCGSVLRLSLAVNVAVAAPMATPVAL